MLFFYQYYYIIIPAIIFTMYAQGKVTSTFNKYSRISNERMITGAQAAQLILDRAGIRDVRIERIRGSLTDYYDPSEKVLRLSDSVYSSSSIAAVGVAAHEAGHAIQHDEEYGFLSLRTALVPLTNISSRMSMPLIILGCLFGGAYSSTGLGYGFIVAGIALFSLAVAFSLVTLPVEFNASSRAIDMLEATNILSADEMAGAKKTLSAAAMTYVAAAASAILSLLRLVLIFGRRND